MKKIATLMIVASAFLIGCSGGSETVSEKDAKGTENAVTSAPDTGKTKGGGAAGTRAADNPLGAGGGRTGGAPPPVNPGG